MKNKKGNSNSHNPDISMDKSIKKLLPGKNHKTFDSGVTDDAPFSTAEYEMIAPDDMVNNQES
ncbi:MAG: hypothetical protein IJD07_02150 [Clostridia bacterium]|nr:hypothetical protein [Clostridia bacterium]